jgi:hypothetical protein
MSNLQAKAIFDQAQAQRLNCRDWLIPHMIDNKPKAFTKDEYRMMAMQDLGVSKSAFDAGWIWAIEDTGRQDWYEPKPRGKSVAHN